MREIVDFIAGRSNKLLRDLIGASFAIVVFCFGALLLISSVLDNIRESRSFISLPPKITKAPDQPSNEIRTVTRSVLDDNLITGSVRPIILDPCTGKEKK